MLDVYQSFAKSALSAGLETDKLTTFNLDEYIGLPANHPQSYRTYMNDNLFANLNIPLSQTYIPRGDALDPEEEAHRYEALLSAAGGLDFQLLGLGENGHIGFNEPSSSLASRTRVKTLTRSTRDANRRYFGCDEGVPKLAITMGIRSIMDAKSIVLLATGSEKAQAVFDMIEGPVSASCPASALQFHQNTTIILDQSSAAELRNTEYYQHVHKDGV